MIRALEFLPQENGIGNFQDPGIPVGPPGFPESRVRGYKMFLV